MPDPTPTPDGSDADGPELSPEQDAAVRRLLAEAGGPEALPDDVATRLEETLAELRAERDAADLVSTGVAEEHGVVLPRDELAGRRRRKARLLLVAAAAVLVGAVAAGQLADRPTDDAAVAGQSAEDDPARTADSAGGAALQEGAELEPDASMPGDLEDSAQDDGLAARPLERVPSDGPLRSIRADRLREDLVALQHVSLPDPATVDYSGAVFVAPQDFMCEPADFGAGHLVAVEYAGRPAVVAFRAPAGTTQEADVLACGTGDTLHSVTLATAG
ncbi:hypothetical protein ACFQ0K_08280 [Nocardioides caeni]|uniref:Uncharacterized protein n=1 Tax=Nocardioides caeni TaxID=574700 RepID=A0A4S8N3M4_9ACTN|nr:hypothetical protein [Nocardioides caeni]THV10121.1 hypothetical protein E9934_15030 [Nocardioides caeni]